MSAPDLSTVKVDVQLATQILKVLSTYDFKGAIAAFEGQDPEVQVKEGLMTADAVLSILGLFIPEAAMADEYVRLAEVAVPVAWPLMVALMAKLPPPHKLQPDEYEAWGHTFKR